jgi:hypothetical protein
MTREEILAMQPGRELDARVAENVMGYKFVQEGSTLWKEDAPFPFLMYNEEFGYCLYEKYEDGWPFTTFNPSTDISAAWEVVEKIGNNAEWMLYRLGHTDEEGILKYNCTFLQVFSGFSPSAKGITAPEAICKAALLAVLEATP